MDGEYVKPGSEKRKKNDSTFLRTGTRPSSVSFLSSLIEENRILAVATTVTILKERHRALGLSVNMGNG